MALACPRCGLECFHRVIYVGPLLVETVCASCGLTTGIDHDEVCHAYVKEPESRLRTTSRPMLRAASRSSRRFTLHLSVAVLTKPYKLGEELASLHHAARTGR